MEKDKHLSEAKPRPRKSCTLSLDTIAVGLQHFGDYFSEDFITFSHDLCNECSEGLFLPERFVFTFTSRV